MKLTKEIAQALNDQINLELASAYAYLGMSAYFEHEGYTGFAAWMRLQGREENGHADRFFKYLLDRDGKVELQAIEKPRIHFKSPLEAFEASLAHEEKVSASINRVYELAAAHKDYATQSFLKWFLDEQVEEEKTVTEIINRLKLVGDSAGGLMQLDAEGGRRAAAPRA
jgi:ferritin